MGFMQQENMHSACGCVRRSALTRCHSCGNVAQRWLNGWAGFVCVCGDVMGLKNENDIQWCPFLPWFSCALSTAASSYHMNTLENILPSSDKSKIFFLSLSVSAAWSRFNDCVGGRGGASLPRVSHFSAHNCWARPQDCECSSVGGEVEVEEKLTRPVRPVRKARMKAAHRAPGWLTSDRLDLQSANHTRCNLIYWEVTQGLVTSSPSKQM